MQRQPLALTFVACLAAATAIAGTRIHDAGIRGHRTRLATSISGGINAAPDHTCAVLDDGTVRCWGGNFNGQLGDGTILTRTAPVQVSGLVAASSVSAGKDFSCALLGGTGGGGTVRCWGNNSVGQLGNGNTTQSPTSVGVSGLSGVIQIASGLSHTCALLVDGTVHCWGDNSSGQLGTGALTGTSSVPVKVNLALTPVVAISAGAGHTCAVLVGGTMTCWGLNINGQLGFGTPGSTLTPGVVLTQSSQPLSRVVDVSAGFVHTCALTADGAVFCWGSNKVGQVGDGGDSGNRPFASPVQLTVVPVAISSGQSHTCVIRANGTVQCWGDNTFGQLGDGTTAPETVPQTTVLGLSNALEVSGGNFHTCVMDSTGAVRCWGSNTVGQLGNATTSPSLTPATVSGITGSIGARGIYGGSSTTCAVRGSGGVSCWGEGGSGQLGNGVTPNSANPVNVNNLSDVINVSVAVTHACAVVVTGGVSCWGDNTLGALGNVSRTIRLSGSVPGVANAVQVAAGINHTCALIATGTVQCWGGNQMGQLGNNSQTQSLTPVAVSGLNGVIAITAGDNHTCAIRAAGPMACWGANALGQLGDGAAENTALTPVSVAGLDNAATGLTAEASHSCALLANGGVRCWGENTEGLLGNSTTQPRSVPDTVVGLTDAIAISTGLAHTCAVRVEGSAVCWGADGELQLGAIDNSNHFTPTPVIRNFTTVNGVQIPNKLAFVVAVAAAEFSTCALQTSGQVYCWGVNFAGEAGTGAVGGNIARPGVVNSFTANVMETVTLELNGHVASVTALLSCEEGGNAFLYLTLTQGNASGSGVAFTGCDGGLNNVQVIVPAFTLRGFQDGPATAQVEAVVADELAITQTQHWQRDVTLVTPAPQ